MERLIGTGVAIALMISSAIAHDSKRPDLDNWYANLHRQGFAKCCDKSDCHTTEAEMRPDGDGLGHSHWWARPGTPIYRSDPKTGHILGTDWVLGDYVEIPDDTIVRDEKGRPVANPEGEAVICHELKQLGPRIYCFVPAPQS